MGAPFIADAASQRGHASQRASQGCAKEPSRARKPGTAGEAPRALGTDVRLTSDAAVSSHRDASQK